MDLKLNSIAWVGKNISQKFETMCQEVDNIVSQNTVKYVENQMQTMGKSVKKFCSDVVQDLLPPSADLVKHEAQDSALKRNDAIDTYIKSVIGIEENSADTISKQSHNEPNPVDPVKTNTVPYQENQLITPSSVDHAEGKKSELVAGKIGYVLTHEIADVDVEENAIREKSSTNAVLDLMSLGEKGSFEASSICQSSDHHNKNSCRFVEEISHVTSVDDSQTVDTVCDNLEDDSVGVSDASDTFAASEMAFSVASCDEKVLETGLVSLSNSRLMESDSLHDDSPDNFPPKTVLYTAAVDGVGCVSDSCDAIQSLTSSSIVSCKGKEAEVEHISSRNVLSVESVEDVSKTNYTMSQTEISRKIDPELCGSAQFEALATSSGNGMSVPSHNHCGELDYSGMETIELCDNVKLEDSCIMVDNSALYAVSYRTRKLRSFKQRIQDAFASKKRLAKEYEQLAIWFGDIYIGDSQDTLQNFLPSTTSVTLDLDKSSKNHTCDSEWELL